MDFSEALNVKVGEIERPPLPPTGYYRWKVAKQPNAETTKDGNWDILEFSCAAQEALEGVDPQALQDFGGLKMVRLSNKFLFDKQPGGEHETAFQRTLFGVRQFLIEHLGVDASLNLKEAIAASIGKEFIAPLEIRLGKDKATGKDDPNQQFPNMGRTAPVTAPAGSQAAA
jgi:hypothetical protein